MNDVSPPNSPDTIVKGLKAVAAHFGKSLRQVQRWAKEPDFPWLSGRRYDLLQVQAWLDARQGRPQTLPASRQANRRQGVLGPEPRGKDYQDERQKRFKADLLEMQLRQRRGELVERAEVEQMFVGRIMGVKAGLLALPRALPPQLTTCRDEREMEAVIDRAVRALLESFSRPLPDSIGGAAESGGQNVAQGGGFS